MWLWAVSLAVIAALGGLLGASGLELQTVTTAALEIGAVVALFVLVCASEAWT